jgi:4-hydroxybenzoate polyprenyltransferase
MLSYLRLFRLPNLLMIALTQFLVRYCIIMPAYVTEYHNTDIFPDHLSRIEFLLIMFSTIVIAAGGYVINDVYDVFTDEINKPGKNIVGNKISERTARTVSNIFFIIGSIAGIALAIKKHIIVMGLIFPFSAASLYMYASYYKKRLLVGNMLIALLSALSVLIVTLFEPHFYINIQFVAIYTVFAFLISLVRELIKDAEDLDGDERSQSKTFPVRFGIRKTKMIALLIMTILAGTVGFYLYRYFYHNTVINFWYLLAIFMISFAALSYLIASATEKKDFTYASIFAKLVMLYGILTMIPFYYYFLK